MFPEKLPGPGGFASLGVAWEQGQELPIGFTKKVIGFPRVANNCASCHTASYRKSANENPVFVPTGPNHTLNLQAFFRFVVDCARDPRFNAEEIMREIALVYELPLLDRLIYRYALIPITKKRLLEREAQFKWVYHKEFPSWGRGRDDAMNLTKYFLLNWPMDDTIGPTDMPSVWNLKKYQPEKGMLMNLAGDSHDARSVIIDSALGLLNAEPHDRDDFMGQIDWLVKYLSELQAPKYPFPIQAEQAKTGKAVFDANCAGCHASERTGTRVPVEEVGTDRERLKTWSKQAAIESNKVVRNFGIERRGLVENDPVDTSHNFWTASGCARLICTTDRCRLCAIYSNRSLNVQRYSIAAMTFTTRKMSGSLAKVQRLKESAPNMMSANAPVAIRATSTALTCRPRKKTR
jgi:mono/diheme cytochrome c family protein